MKNAVRGTLLSGLVFPGLGQLVLGQRRRGAVIVLAVLTSMAVIVLEILRQALDMLEQIEAQGDIIDITAISNAATLESVESGGVMLNLAMIFLVVCWVAGTIDAYRIGRKKDLQQDATDD